MKNQKASKLFIFITILLDAIGIGIVIPIMPEVIKRFGTDPGFVSSYFGYFISVYALMQFVASPFLGSLSDKFGRRPVLLVSLLGSGLDYLLMAFAPNMLILFLGRIMSGLTGANQTVASSYIADISTNENRAANFGMIGAAFGIGFVAGPAIGGFVGSFGHHWPFIIAAILTIANFLFGLFILPESLPVEKRRDLDIARLNPIRSLTSIILRPSLSVFVIIYFLTNLAGQVHPSIWTLYTTYKFQWTSLQVGMSLAMVGIAFGLGQGVATQIITPRIGEENSVKYGTLLLSISYLLYALATKGWMIYPIISLMVVCGVTMPSLQSLMTKGIPSEEQGELQGSLVSIMSLTSIIGPLLYTHLFSAYTKIDEPSYPGAPYVAASVVSLICLALIFSNSKKGKKGARVVPKI
jgi:DHA1 family tetracycline resistance protein-like MFS transporter